MHDSPVLTLDFDPTLHGHALVRGGSVQQEIIAIKQWAAEQDGEFVVLAPWAAAPPRPHWTQVTQPIAWAGHLDRVRSEIDARYERLASREHRAKSFRPLFVIIDESALLSQYVNERPRREASSTGTGRDAVESVSDIVRLGRAAGVHLVAAASGTQGTVHLNVLRDCGREFDLNG